MLLVTLLSKGIARFTVLCTWIVVLALLCTGVVFIDLNGCRAHIERSDIYKAPLAIHAL